MADQGDEDLEEEELVDHQEDDDEDDWDSDDDLGDEPGDDLFRASERGDVAEATRLLDLGAPINHRAGVTNETPLMAAASRGHLEVVVLLSDRGADIEASDAGGYRAIMLASENGHLSILKFLAERGADLEALSNDRLNALILASSGGHMAIVQYIADKGGSINTRDNYGEDALLYAALWGHPEISLFLIARGADPRVVNNHGRSALTHAGIYTVPDLSPEEQKRIQEQLRVAFWAGPHPDARWARRRALMLVLAGCRFQPLAGHAAALQAAALPTDVPLPPLPNSTPDERRALRHGKVLGNLGLVKRVASFM
jgi:ankyrin repeat protein